MPDVISALRPAPVRPVPVRRGPPDSKLHELYDQYFQVVPANSPALLVEVYRLRYQVYCVENQFENPDEHPFGLETDAFDDHAVHSLLVHRASGAFAGTVRLVLPQPGTQGSLPIHHLCGDQRLRDRRTFPSGRTAEISRFAISKAFRRRAGDPYRTEEAAAETAPVGPGSVDRRVIPHLTLGLMRAIAEMSIAHGITHLCAVMEPALLRLVRRLGITFTELGPMVEHHGVRQPCYAEIESVALGLLSHRPDALTLISDSGRLWPQAEPQRSTA